MSIRFYFNRYHRNLIGSAFMVCALLASCAASMPAKAQARPGAKDGRKTARKPKPGKKATVKKTPAQSKSAASGTGQNGKTPTPANDTGGLLQNAGFEVGAGNSPISWQQGANLDGVEYLWDKTTAHSGKASLSLKKTPQRFFPIAQWFQNLNGDPNATKIKVSGWIKAANASKATLDVQFLDAGDAQIGHHWLAYIGAKDSGDPPATHDWQKYEDETDVPDGTKRVTVALQIYGPGQVWLDDVRAEWIKRNAVPPPNEPVAAVAAAPPANNGPQEASPNAVAARPTQATDNPKSNDPQVVWLRDHAIALRSLDPTDEDFTDLMPLAAQIGTARVVGLGEESHGDGAAFAAKCRLVRFLHEKMGFDVLAWESGMFDCAQMEAALHTSQPLDQAIGKGLFPIWGVSGHVKPVFEYARATHATPRPLEMAGFDCQFSTSATDKAFQEWVKALQAAGPTLPDGSPTILHDKAQLDDLVALGSALQGNKYAPTPDERKRWRGTVESLRAELDKPETVASLNRTRNSRDLAFARRVLDNLLVYEAMRAETAENPKNANAGGNTRDRAMGENLAWLAGQRYPDRKIIVWAASYHLARNAPKIEALSHDVDYKETLTMGQVAHDALKDNLYTVAFTAYQGRSGNPFFGEHDLQLAAPDTLEAACHAVGKPLLFVPLRDLPADAWLNQPAAARPLGYSPMRAAWPDVFDAIVFTDTMFPSTESGSLPRAMRAGGTAVTLTQTETQAKEALADFRRTAIDYDLSARQVAADAPSGFAANRIEHYVAETQWPDLPGLTLEMVRDPASFTLLPADGKGFDTDHDTRYLLTAPLTAILAPKNYSVLLCVGGITPQGGIGSDTYTQVYVHGTLAGRVALHSYGALVCRGDVSGLVDSSSYFMGLIRGKLTGKFTTCSAGVLYLLGGFSGEIEMSSNTLNGGQFKLYIAGKTRRSDLKRIHGEGKVFLESSPDLPKGWSSVGNLSVHVGPMQAGPPPVNLQ